MTPHDHADHRSVDDGDLRKVQETLTEHGAITADEIDARVAQFASVVADNAGPRIVVRAWKDDGFKRRLLANGNSAVSELGFPTPETELIVLENTESIHNVIVCTLCSCYPWTLLGPPPEWYKEPEYRARVVREPRVVLAEMGLILEDHVQVRVWDSTAETRYMVLPRPPEGTADAADAALEKLISRDALIGVAAL